jgi:hypothetical protein
LAVRHRIGRLVFIHDNPIGIKIVSSFNVTVSLSVFSSVQKPRSRTSRGWTIRLLGCFGVFSSHKVVSFGGVFSSADAIACALASRKRA